MNTIFLEEFYKQCEILHKNLPSHTPQVLNTKQIEEALLNTIKRVPAAPSGLLTEISTRDTQLLLEFVREAYSVWVDYYNLTNYK